jgi:phosphomannomutase
MPERFDCFKAYDIRGRIPDQLNVAIATRIGQAYAELIRPDHVVIGHDIRLSSPEIAGAVIAGLCSAGVSVQDIGLCGTEEIYFATWHLGVGGGIMVTASHNPADYNGMKLVREDAKPISGDTGLKEIRALAEKGDFHPAESPGVVSRVDVSDAYIDHLLSYVDVTSLRPLKIVTNAGNGGAGLVIDRLEPRLPFEFIKIQHEPDGSFPNGVPNPLLPENRQATIDAIRESGADFGLAWDGDFDRCFLFDEHGAFLEGYYVVGLLARSLLIRNPGSKIIHDPRLVWNTQEIVSNYGGIAVQSKTGHAFIKERMRRENALYGGEMSAHHYFRDFAFCDSGMIPWLLIAAVVSESGQTLSSLVAERIQKFPVSGEINREVADPAATLEAIRQRYEPDALLVEEVDGLSFAYADWRFNLRLSNTEPVIRLNVESRGDRKLMEQRTRELVRLVEEL